MVHKIRRFLAFYVLFVSLALCQDPASSQAASAFSAKKPIEAVQSFLRAREKTPTLSVTGNWDSQTQEGVQSFVDHLQSRPIWGHSWNGPKTGIYSADYAAYLGQAIEEAKTQGVDTAELSNLEMFVHAMDKLRQQGIYTYESVPSSNAGNSGSVPVVQASLLPSSTSEGNGFFGPLLLWFANGALSGFGDEIYCAAFHGPSTFSECHDEARMQLDQFEASHHKIAIGANLVGAAVNVFSSMFSLVAIETEWSGLAVLILSFCVGIADCILYTIGDAWTWGLSSVDIGQVVVFSMLSGFVMTWVVAIHRWKYKKPPIKVSIGHHGLFGRRPFSLF